MGRPLTCASHSVDKRFIAAGVLLFRSGARTSRAQIANPVVMVIVLGALALAPFVVIMLTWFVKISVVLSILRMHSDATGSAQPNRYGALFRIDDLHYGARGAENV